MADFDASRPESTHYTADNETGGIAFGDGLHGAIPGKGMAITITYRSGGGARGNIAPNSIRFSGMGAGLGAHNTRSGRGGADAETPDQAVSRVRADLRAVSRAVTSEDFEQLSRESPGGRVARAEALPGYYPGNINPVPGIVSVIIVPRSTLPRPVPSPGLLWTVYRHLDSHRLLGTEVFVLPPEYVEVGVKAELVARARHDETAVLGRAIEAVNAFLDPLEGGVDGQGWPFGRPVYLSEVFEILERVEGVDYVASVLLKKEGSNDWAGDVRIPPHALACAAFHHISAVKRSGGTGA
jgi:predicted phage baseplate assembly protein